MVFSSLTFLFLFFPLVMGVYYLCPRALRNLWLLLTSLLFYACLLYTSPSPRD